MLGWRFTTVPSAHIATLTAAQMLEIAKAEVRHMTFICSDAGEKRIHGVGLESAALHSYSSIQVQCLMNTP